MSVRSRGARAAASTLLASAVLVASLQAQRDRSASAVAGDDQALAARARAIHERVITLDTHVDIDADHFTSNCNYTMRLTTQVDLPKMEEGGLDVAFFIVYVGQGPLSAEGYDGAYRQAVSKFDAIHRLTREIAPDRIGLALTPADVRRLAGEGKRVAVIGVENGYPVGENVARLKEFFDRGGRYMSLAHNGNNQLSDSNTGEREGWKWNGLSPLGRQVIGEMNRLGMMIDISHPSKASILQTLELSKAPVIASHSSARALANHSRNLDDELLLAVKKNGGVVQTVALSSFVKADPPERAKALTALRQEFGLADGQGAAGTAGRGAGAAMGAGAATGAGAARAAAPPGRTVPPCPVESSEVPAGDRGNAGVAARDAALVAQLSPEYRSAYEKRLAEIDRKWPAAGRATVADFVDHIDYMVKLIGIDHVGISSDFDGGGGVEGWSNAAESSNVTLELVRRGYTEDQIGKLWSGNLLRVWQEVMDTAAAIQAGER